MITFIELLVTNLVDSIWMSLFVCSGELVRHHTLYFLVCIFVTRRRQQPASATHIVNPVLFRLTHIILPY